MDFIKKERFINDFAQKALETTGGSFKMELEDNFYFFLKGAAENCFVIYGTERTKNNPELYLDPSDNTMRLVALVTSDQQICIIDPYIFNIFSRDDLKLSDGIFFLEQAVEEFRKEICDTIFPEYYNNLDISKVNLKDYQIGSTKEDARKTILSFTQDPDNCQLLEKYDTDAINNLINSQDAINILAGITTLKEFVTENLVSMDENWRNKKLYYNQVQDLMKDMDSVTKSWEREMADGIRTGLAGIEPKSITVEFSCGGKTAIAKTTIRCLFNRLLNHDYFSPHNFLNTSQAEIMFDMLGVTDCSFHGKPMLTCENISRITYGKKELYVRQEKKAN